MLVSDTSNQLSTKPASATCSQFSLECLKLFTIASSAGRFSHQACHIKAIPYERISILVPFVNVLVHWRNCSDS